MTVKSFARWSQPIGDYTKNKNKFEMSTSSGGGHLVEWYSTTDDKISFCGKMQGENYEEINVESRAC